MASDYYYSQQSDSGSSHEHMKHNINLNKYDNHKSRTSFESPHANQKICLLTNYDPSSSYNKKGAFKDENGDLDNSVSFPDPCETILSQKRQHSVIKNVHFSPIVSQLRYPPADYRYRFQDVNLNDNFSNNNPEGTLAIQRVKVQVQQIEKPLHNKVQRVQISIPHERGQSAEKLAYDLNNIPRTGAYEKLSLHSEEQQRNYNAVVIDNHQRLFDTSLGNNSETDSAPQRNTTLYDQYWDTGSFDGAKGTHANSQVLSSPGFSISSARPKTSSVVTKLSPEKCPCANIVVSRRGINENELTNLSCDCDCVKPSDRKMAAATVAASNATVTATASSTNSKNVIPASFDTCDCSSTSLDTVLNINGHGGGCGGDPRKKSEPSKNTESIELDSILDKDDNGDTKEINTGVHHEQKNKTGNKGHSWPSAYRKLKEKSKPKLSFLHRITFGRFGGGGRIRGGDTSGMGDPKLKKKSQKRISCPPFGPHVLLMDTSASSVSGDNDNSRDGFEHEADTWHLDHRTNEDVLPNVNAGVTNINDLNGGVLLFNKPVNNELKERLSLKWQEKDERKPPVIYSPQNIIEVVQSLPGSSVDDEDDDDDGNDAIGAPVSFPNINASFDLPPKPSPPRPNKSPQLNSFSNNKLGNTVKSRVNNLGGSDADELSVNFERILEGIFGLECDEVGVGTEEKEKKNHRCDFINPQGLSLSSRAHFLAGDEEEIDPLEIKYLTDVTGRKEIEGYKPMLTEDDPFFSDETSNLVADCLYLSSHTHNSSGVITSSTTAATGKLPVIGKPPKPPTSANRLIGMRTGASERFSYLKGRMSATATTETRLAMELAAKLCEFREELRRSREQISQSRPNLDEIENSVRISMAIDRRGQRTLPQSRNSTRVPLPPVLPLLHNEHDSSSNAINGLDGTGTGTFPTRCAPSSSTLPVSGTVKKHQHQPVKPVTEIINEEWESVIFRARETFSKHSQRNQHLLHQLDNNGKPVEDLQSKGIALLETDLDTGASREFPVDDDNSFIGYGDCLRQRDLEKVLKVEDFSQFVPRNSCSLQNITSVFGVVPYTPKMTTLTPEPGASGVVGGKEDRSQSMEFLMANSDKNAHLRPPENTLMKNQETRRVSEHELRIQRSLQKLNVPDWYKNYAPSGSASAAGTPSKSRDFGSGSGLAGGWPGLSTSKTSSLTSLQSAGRYAGSKSGFAYGRHRAAAATASTGGRSSRESLMSPSSTASASPSPNFERSSFTYGMPYALTRFAAARMSCGASPASLSPSPSPVGGIGTSTSTPVSSGPSARYGYQKQPYLGWRSQERLSSKALYRTPAERLAADIIAQKAKPPPPPITQIVVEQPPSPEIEVKTSPKKEIASSDLSLNNSEESNSHKLNRVRSSIKEVSNAIVDYVNETKPLDDGMNGRASPRRGLVWLESSFVGTKPIDSPGTPDTPSTFISTHRGSRKDSTTAFRFDEPPTERSEVKSGESSSTSHYTSYVSRNEQMEERSNSSSVSSPTLEDVLDSLLALRRPNKKFRSRGKGHESLPSTKPATSDGVGDDSDGHYTPSSYTPTSRITTTTTTASASVAEEDLPQRVQSRHTYRQYDYEPSTTSEIYSLPYELRSSTKNRFESYSSASAVTTASSDWQDRMNQPLADSTFISGEPETFTLTGSRNTSAPGAEYGTGSSSISRDPCSGISSTSSYFNSSSTYDYEKTPLADRFSSASVTTTTSVKDPLVSCSSSSSANIIHSASSSLHSTPTHQTYQYKHQQQHIQSPASSSISSATAAAAAAIGSSGKEYYYSSTSSSPAKSCLDSSTTQRDENELRQSLLRSGVGAGDDEEELAFGNPTEIRSTVTTSTVAPVTGGVIVNPLTGLSEYSNPPTPARHRRVSFDLDFSDKEEKSSSRSRNKEENVGGTIQCRNTKCGKTATGLEARREFKVCHNCNAYYCSRECRRSHWEKHKKTCMQSRVGAICKQIISHVKEDSYVMNQLSTVAKRGFLAKGRGCVKLFFNSPDRAERFLTGGLPDLPEPLYIPYSDMLPEEMGAQIFSELSDQCKSYNPDTRFVLYACVCVVNEVPTYGAVKWERELISRSSKLRLLLPRNFYDEAQRHHHAPANPAHLMSALQDPPNNGRISPAPPPSQPSHHQNVPLYDSVAPSVPPGGSGEDDLPPPPLPPHQTANNSTTSSSENETLILRSVPPPSSHQLNHSEHKRLREVSFTNIQKHLLQRGVDLKKTYPDIYNKLCKYVEHDEPFLPVTIYPRNSQTGSQFVCVIMPESSDSAYTAAAEESGQRHPLQRVETINISEQDDDEVMDLT